MKILTLMLLIFVSKFMFAQNWLPIDTAKEYNFLIDSSKHISRSIVTTQNNDTTFFETIIDSCNYFTNPSFYNDTFLMNHPDFFGYFMLNNFDTSYTFYGNDTISIKPLKEVGEHWQYTSNVLATVISKELLLIDTILDSVKTILLSTNDTLILSKTLGILSFPYLHTNTVYTQVGIENIYGLQNLRFWDVFDFNVGDIFQYIKNSATSDDDHYPPPRNEKVTILHKTTLQNGFKYYVSVKIRRPYYENYPHTSFVFLTYDYSEYEDTLTYLIENDTLLIKTTGGVIDVSAQSGGWSNKVKHTSFYKQDTSGRLIKVFDVNPFNTFDPLIQLNDSVCVKSFGILRFEYGKNIGLVLGRGEFFESNFIEKLIGYYKGTDTVGIIHSDAFYSKIKNVSVTDLGISFYPNPTQNQLVIENKEKKRITIDIINSLGQNVYTSSISDNTTINTKLLSKGIYYLVVCNNIGKCGSSKIVKN